MRFFRATDFTIAMRLLRGMFGAHAQADAILGTREMLSAGDSVGFMKRLVPHLRTALQH